MRIMIVTIKQWNIENYRRIVRDNNEEIKWKLITNNEELCIDNIKKFNPDYIFFPHWSWIIPKEIYEMYKCIVFHMTDLPFGRGGSPLQNLISRGIENTKISAIRVVKELDAGDIYLKKNLNLNGTADEIFTRASKIIFKEMIPEIIKDNIKPIPQKGEIVHFERRKPEQSKIEENIENIESIYDKVRMLDGEGYPKAYIKFGRYRIEFSRAQYNGKDIIADARIVEENHE